MSKSTLSCLYAFVCIALCVASAVTATKTEVGGWWVHALVFAIVAFIFAVFSVDRAAK